MDINRLTICGGVGKDPEIRTMNSGGRVANFSVATKERYKDKAGQWVDSPPVWITISTFAEHHIKKIEDQVRKGTRVFVEGKLNIRKASDQSGNDRYFTELVLPPFGGVLEVLAAGTGRGGGDTQDRSQAPQERGYDDSIPF